MDHPKAVLSFLFSSIPDTKTAEAARCSKQHFMSDGSELGDKAEESGLSVRSRKRLRVMLSMGLSSIIAVFLIGFTYGMMLETTTSGKSDQPFHLQNPVLRCRNPTVRREWRSLDRSEKTEYITAVNCLRALPSTLGLNQTLYDDFPLIHSQIGNYSHKTSAFIVWHRYFIHVYEDTLRQQCGYTGSLTYWDWSKDWENILESPVWDSESGFGGNGNLSDEKSVAYGYCVTDGPFARLRALIFGGDSKIHCLSRGFVTDEAFRREKAVEVRPDILERLLDEPNYESFNLRLEYGPHDAIPLIIRGDFYKVTAPYDPIFFLHHTQLDRLWWMWQQRDPQKREMEYLGKPGEDVPRDVSLSDMLDVGDLARNAQVSEVMNTRTGILCYQY